MIPMRLTLLIAIVLADESPEQSIEEKISEAASKHRLRLDFDGELFSGPAWDRLVAEGADAQFFLLGEEHGIGENPLLAAQLFSELTDHGYSKLAIEISPTPRDMVKEPSTMVMEPPSEPSEARRSELAWTSAP